MRFATIGTSSITKKWIAAGKVHADFTLAAVYSRSIEKAAAFAKEQGAAAFYSDLKEVAEDETIDAIYIASPNALHYSQTKQLLLAGKHVLCEKTMTTNASQAQELFAIAEEKGLILMEAMRSLYDPAYPMIKALIPALGQLRQIDFRFGKYSSKYDAFLAGQMQNIFDPACSAGALMDMGVYCVEPLVYLFGPSMDLTAKSVILSTGVDGAGEVLASYPNMQAHLAYTKLTNDELPCQIQGEKATLLISNIASPRQLTLVASGSRKNALTDMEIKATLKKAANVEINAKAEANAKADAVAEVEKVAEDRWQISVPGPVENMEHEIRYFMDLADGKQTVNLSRQITVPSIRMMDAIREICGINFPADATSQK